MHKCFLNFILLFLFIYLFIYLFYLFFFCTEKSFSYFAKNKKQQKKNLNVITFQTSDKKKKKILFYNSIILQLSDVIDCLKENGLLFHDLR